MKKKLISILKSKRGAASVETAVVFMFVMLVFSVILQYATTMTVIQDTKDSAQRVLDSLLIKNATDIFSSIKNGRSSVKEDQVAELEAIGVNGDAFMENLATEMGLAESANGYFRGSEDDSVFILERGFDINTATEDKLKVEASVYFGKTLSFGGVSIELKVPLTVDSLYTRKNDIAAGKEIVTTKQDTNNLLNKGGDAVEDVIEGGRNNLPTPEHNNPLTTAPPKGGSFNLY